eukprot:4057774-Pyramimonas_sp.AAC.1
MKASRWTQCSIRKLFDGPRRRPKRAPRWRKRAPGRPTRTSRLPHNMPGQPQDGPNQFHDSSSNSEDQRCYT